MKIAKIFCLMLLILSLTSFAFAEVNSGQFMAKNGAGASLDYKFAGDLNTNLYDNEISWTNKEGNNVPVTCDIDKDGRQEVIGYSGNTLRIFGMDEFDVLNEEQTIELTPLNGTIGQINSIACQRMSGDFENDSILIVHQGINTQSGGANTLGNQILFIEWQPEHQNLLQLNWTYSEDLVLVGAYHNAPQIQAGEIVCDGKDDPFFPADIEDNYLCGYANVVSAITFFKPSGIQEFWCDDSSQFGNAGGSACVYFNITDNAGHKLNFEQEGTYNNRAPAGSYTLVMDVFGNPFWHIMENVNSVSIWEDLLDTPSFARNSLTTGLMSFYPWSFLRNIDGTAEDSVCYHGTNLFMTSNDANGYHWCANADGTLSNLETLTVNGGNRIDMFNAFSYYDANQDGTKTYNWYGSVGQYNDLIKQAPKPIHSTSFIGQVNTGCGHSGGAVTGNCPQSVFIANYRDQINKSVLIIGNYVNVWDSNLDTFAFKGQLPISETNIIRPVDLNNDNNLELLIIETITGNAHIYSMQPDLTPFEFSLDLINTTKVGDGYFGFSTGVNCADTSNVTFKATECIGLNTECTYTSTNPTSQERIGTTCGGTQNFTYGAYSFTSPEVQCNFTTGSYNITLTMESTELPTINQASNAPPIPLIVESGIEGVSCNLAGQVIANPTQSPVDEFDVPDEGGEPTTPVDEPSSSFLSPIKTGYVPDETTTILGIDFCKVESGNFVYDWLHMVTLCNGILQLLITLFFAGFLASLPYFVSHNMHLELPIGIFVGTLFFFGFIKFIPILAPLAITFIIVFTIIVKNSIAHQSR